MCPSKEQENMYIRVQKDNISIPLLSAISTMEFSFTWHSKTLQYSTINWGISMVQFEENQQLQ